MIDLHTHTTASDGLCAPDELVSRAAAAGVTVLSVTDHDTVAGCEPAARAAASAGVAFVPGIEITAIVDGVDVHVLGYLIDAHSQRLRSLLAGQLRSRFDRVREMVGRLASFGMMLDADAILQPAVDDPGKAPGRPWVARALVAAGHVRTTDEAFDRWLETKRPGFVPRHGPPPSEVFACIHEAGGVASLAHPGLLKHDEWIARLVDDGLDALEAYHSRHDAAATTHYLNLAKKLGRAVSGGSDYHGDQPHGRAGLGSISLPRAEFERLIRSKPAAGYT